MPLEKVFGIMQKDAAPGGARRRVRGSADRVAEYRIWESTGSRVPQEIVPQCGARREQTKYRRRKRENFYSSPLSWFWRAARKPPLPLKRAGFLSWNTASARSTMAIGGVYIPSAGVMCAIDALAVESRRVDGKLKVRPVRSIDSQRVRERHFFAQWSSQQTP